MSSIHPEKNNNELEPEYSYVVHMSENKIHHMYYKNYQTENVWYRKEPFVICMTIRGNAMQ